MRSVGTEGRHPGGDYNCGLMALISGTKLGAYEIQSPLGTGGMGEVYRATDTKLGRDVALKVLPAEMARDPERLARFRARRRPSPHSTTRTSSRSSRSKKPMASTS